MTGAPRHRIFVWLLRRLPAAYTPTDVANMSETFSRRAQRAQRNGAFRYVLFLIKEFAGLLGILIKEHAASVSWRPSPDRLASDLRQAVRRLRSAPGFTTATVLTLALAIGVNTAAFSLLHRLVLAPLPYPAADRLMAIDHDAPGIGLRSLGLSLGLYWEYAALPSVEAIALYYTGEQTLAGSGDAEQLPFLHTTPSIGGILGVRPIAGRWFTEAEGRPGAPPVVFLSHDLWVRRFSAAPTVVGTTVRLNGIAHEVVGVGAPGAAFPDGRIQFAVPLPLTESNRRVSGFNYQGIARLAPAATIENARRHQDAVIADIPRRFSDDPEVTSRTFIDGRLHSAMIPLAPAMVGETAQLLWLLAGAALVVLLVAISNLANLNIVRADARELELATRRALGAGRAAIMSTVLTEAAIVAVAGGILGSVGAAAGITALVADPTVSWPRAQEISAGPGVWLLGLGLTVGAAIMLGAIPMVGRHTPAAALLRGGGRTQTRGPRAGLTRQVLIATQVGLVMVLLTAAALLGLSANRLRHVDPGFTPESRLVFRLGLPRSVYRTRAAAAAFHDQLLLDLQRLPGVQRAALSSNLPLEGRGMTNPMEVFGQPESAGDPLVASARLVSADYFSTMGIALLRGRQFEDRDMTPGANVTVVDQTFASAFFPGADALGQRVRQTNETPWLTIIGVVGSTPTESLRERQPARVFYMPGTNIHQSPYVVQTSGDPMAILPEVRRLVAARDATVAISRPERLSDLLSRSNADVSLVTVAFSVAAAAALLLGVVGVYGVVAYVAAQRRSEIGIRQALGASRAHVTALVARQSAGAVMSGFVLGLGVSLLAARSLQAWLFGVSPDDPMPFVLAAVVTLTGGGVACWWPARCASAVDPLRAMRQS